MAGSGDTALYVTGLPAGCDDEKVKEIFSKFGTVVSLKVLASHPSKPDVAAIVSMESAEKAKWVVDNVSGTVPDGLSGPVEVKLKNAGWGAGKGGESQGDGSLYVSGLPAGTDDEKVTAIFSQYGPVKSVKVLRPQPGKDDAAAIVSMVSAEQAKMLIENVSGTTPAGLPGPVEIKAKLPSQSWGKGWGKGDMDPWAMMQMMYSMGKGGGKGGGMGYGMGKGKWGGQGSSGLSSFPADKKVWVGGLPEDTTFGELQTHFGGSGTAKFATVMKGKGAGTGGVAFASAEDATKAIETLNGSSLKGCSIVVDVWTKKEAPAEA